MTGLRLVLIVMFVPLLIRLLSGKHGKFGIVDGLFIAHACWMAVALAVNNPSQAVENIGSTVVEFFGGYLVARTYVRTKEEFLATIKDIFTIIIALVPLAIYEAKTGTAFIPKLISSIPGLGSVDQVTIPKRMGLERVQANFAHPIHFGLFCSTAVSFALIGVRGSIRESRRIFTIAAIAICIFLSLSSGALLSGILQVGLATWAWLFRNIKQRWWILLGLFALAYLFVDLLSNRSPIKVLMSYATFSAHTAFYRSIIFEWGMMNVWDNPIFGLGLNQWIRPRYMVSGTMDNFWLVMAVRYGIPGFLLVAAGYLWALVRVGRAKLSFDPILVRIRLAWMITFLGLSFTLCTVHIWTAAYSFVFFLLGSGLWMADVTYRPEDVSFKPVAAKKRSAVAYSRVSKKEKLEANTSSKGDVNLTDVSRKDIRYTRFEKE